MKDKKIILLTGDNNFFGQTRKPWVTMDVAKLQQGIRDLGFDVEQYGFHQILNQGKPVTDSIIFYTFSQKKNRREYIKDVIRYLDNGGNVVIPSYDLLLCHENKGFQEIFKKKIQLDSLQSFYLANEQELPDYAIDFPVVLKTVDTSNGKGVFLANSRDELIRLVRRLERQNFFTRLDLVRRKYFRRKKHYKDYPEYSNRTDYYQYKDYVWQEKCFILQEFVPDLTYDYRVLIFFDRYYVMKRYTKKDDFRASGTKIQEYDIEVDPGLLNYSREVYAKFDTPFLSLDIGVHKNNYCLFEFQALHFGMNVLVRSVGFHKFENNNWQFHRHQTSVEIETEMANALVKYVNSRHFPESK